MKAVRKQRSIARDSFHFHKLLTDQQSILEPHTTYDMSFKLPSLFQVIKIMSISHGDRSVELPSLNVEHNYPHLLSELVMKL